MGKKILLATRIRLWAGFFSKISYRRDIPLVIQSFSKRRKFQIPDEIRSVMSPIKGFLSRKEAGLLYWAASEWPLTGPVLELGSYAGRSTILFALAGRRVCAVDAWDEEILAGANAVFDSYQENIRRVGIETKVSTHRGLSHKVGQSWTVPGAILFVDAGHDYELVRGDLDIWAPHLLPGGILIMHDVIGDVFLGVTRAASEFLQQGWHVVASAGSIVAFARNAHSVAT